MTKIIQLFPNGPKKRTIETEEDVFLKLLDTWKAAGFIVPEVTEDNELTFVPFLNAIEVCQYRQIIADLPRLEKDEEPVLEIDFLRRLVDDLIYDRLAPPTVRSDDLVPGWVEFLHDFRTVVSSD